jgi:hypothetical protein
MKGNLSEYYILFSLTITADIDITDHKEHIAIWQVGGYVCVGGEYG